MTGLELPKISQPEILELTLTLVVDDKTGTSVSNSPRRFWNFRESKKKNAVPRAANRVRSFIEKLKKKLRFSTKSLAPSRSSIVSTKAKGRVTIKKEPAGSSTFSKNSETDLEAEIYTPNFYRTPCTTHEANQIQVVDKSGNKPERPAGEPKDHERNSTPRESDSCKKSNSEKSKFLTLLKPHSLMFLCSHFRQSGELVRTATFPECMNMLQASKEFHRHWSHLIFISTFSAADFKHFIVRKLGHVELKRQPKQICGSFPKLICAGTQKSLDHEKQIATLLVSWFKGDKWARATDIGSSFWYAKVRNGKRQEKEKEKEPEKNEKPEKHEENDAENDSDTSSCYDSSDSRSDSGSESDPESFSDYAILAEAIAKFPKTKDFEMLFDYFSPYARGKHPVQVYGIRGEFDTLLKELVLASNFPTFHEELVRMGHDGYREKAQETFALLEMGIQSVQKYLLSDFFTESRAAFQFTETTFNKGVALAKRFYELEDRFMVDLYDYQAVLDILVAVQYLHSELDLWHLDVELAAKKSKHVHVKIGNTMELYHLSTRDCACKAQRILDLYQRYFHTVLVGYYPDASYGEIHNMHGFDGARFEDMWVAQLLVEKNLEILKKGVAVLTEFCKELGETLEGVIDSCKKSVSQRKLF